MALAIRMSRGGRKAAPFYRIVVADSRAPRDGNYLERLGTYDPRLPSDNPARVTLKEDRIKHWLSVGAQPSERVALFLGKAGVIPMPERAVRPNKSAPKAKAQERIKANAELAQAKIDAAEQAKADAAAAAEQAKIDAAAAAAAPAEAVAADAPTEAAVAEASAAAPDAASPSDAQPAEATAEEPKA